MKNLENPIIHFRTGNIYSSHEAIFEFSEYDVYEHLDADWGEFCRAGEMPRVLSEWASKAEAMKHWLTNEETVHVATGKVYENVDQIIDAYPELFIYYGGAGKVTRPFKPGDKAIFRKDLPDEQEDIVEALMVYWENGLYKDMVVTDTETGNDYDSVDSVSGATGCDFVDIHLHCNKLVPKPRFVWKDEKDPDRKRVFGDFHYDRKK